MKQEIEQDGVQNPKQAVQAEAPEDTVQSVNADTPAEGVQAVEQGVKQEAVQDDAPAPVKIAGILVNLPGTKEKPVLITVSMRLSPEVKGRLQAMAVRRRMSLGEFCAAVMADVAKAGEAEKTEAA